jgi:polyhydroxyalkanoate synthesis regulator protein
MQGMMGTMLEKNMQAFADLQSPLGEQARACTTPSSFTPEMWTSS